MGANVCNEVILSRQSLFNLRALNQTNYLSIDLGLLDNIQYGLLHLDI